MADLKKLKFRWTINDFDMCMQLPNQMMESQIFSIDTLESTRFSLRIYPRGNKRTKIPYVSFFLKRHQDVGPETILLQYAMSLQTHERLHSKKLSPKREFQKGSSWGYATFCQRDSALKLIRNVVETKKLTFDCLLSPLPASECDDSNESDVYEKEIRENLSMNMAEVLKNGIHSDMCLVVQDEIFNVHRYILECRCPELMLQIPPLSPNSKYYFSGIAANDVRSFLHYLYTGILSASSMSKDILAASCTFGLPDICNAFSFPFNKLEITEVDVMRQSFEWIIEDINEFKKRGELVYNLFYSKDFKKRIKMGLSMPQNVTGCNNIFLKIQNISTDNITCFRCRIIFREPQISPIAIELEHTFEKEKSWETNLISDIQSVENMDFPKTLRLLFEMSISNGKHTSKLTTLKDFGKKGVNNLQLLQKDLKSLLNNATGSDVTLSVGGTKFKAHKAILCSSSKVFASMLKQDTNENQEGNIDIEDLDETTVSSMLMYIYYGYIKLNESEAVKLHAAADKYDLPALKEKCSTFLKWQKILGRS